MADAKKCDICKELYENYGEEHGRCKPNTMKLYGKYKDGGSTMGTTYDCCPTCMNIIRDLIKSLTPKEEKEDEETNSILNS